MGYRLTEMFKKSFRKEYLSLHEYKTCSLDIDIQKMTQYAFKTKTKRKIVGHNNGQELVYFEYKNQDNSITLKFENKLMEFDYEFKVSSEDYDEEEVRNYIDFMLKSNAANVRAEQLIF